MRRGMAKYLLLITCSFVTIAYAVAPGFYMGFMMGPATNGGKVQNINLTTGGVFQPNIPCAATAGTTPVVVAGLPCCKKQCTASCQACVYVPPQQGDVVPANPRSQQIGARVFLGNQINSIVSFESGSTLFNNIDYKAKTNLLHNPSATAHVKAFDIVIKGAIPFRDIADVYAKAGIAITYLTLSGGLTQSGRGTYKTNFRPTFSLGATYDFNQNWVGDLSYTYIQVGNQIKSVNFIALGFSYHFVNIYCGQFLCDS